MPYQWHWLKEDMTAGHGSEPPWTEGEARQITGDITLCQRGYHSSPSPWRGFQYAPGPVLCLVEISDPYAWDETKSVSAERKLIKAINVERQLREFACDTAEEALNREERLGRAVDERSRAAVEVARRFVQGQSSSEELAAAHAAAAAAADAATYAAAAAAADAATYAATYAAAHARSAGYARFVAEAAAERRFNALIEPLFAEAV